MSIKALQEYVRISKYARFNEKTGKQETWEEQVERMFNMHREFLGASLCEKLKEDLDFAERAVKRKAVLGSQRALQFGGTPILKHHARLFNCAGSLCDRPAFFREAMYLLLCGSGVGFSVRKRHVSKLPALILPDRSNILKVTVADSIEGWADALDALLRSFFDEQSEFRGRWVEFDYSLVRPKGAPISWGAKAPGPDGLSASLERIRRLLMLTVPLGRLRSVDAMDVLLHASDAVLSGGIRRSACLALCDRDDTDMISAKTGDWFTTNPQRGRANISVALDRKNTSEEEFRRIVEMTRQFGEPGFVWISDDDSIVNPCGEVTLYPVDTDTGSTGWSLCNLSEINMKKVSSAEDFYMACKAASIIGTVQAAYSSFPYLGPVTERIVRRDALIGVGLTGMSDNPGIALNPEIQREGAAVVLKVNEQVAKVLDICPAKRATVVKPAGTSSCLLGTSSGIHPHHASRYLRRVMANDLEPAFAFFRDHNPAAVEDSVSDVNRTDRIITFLCEVPDGSKTKNQTPALEMLKWVRTTQENWIEYGTRDRSSPLRHSVSNTITVMPDEWDSVISAIYEGREKFGGVTLLPFSGDKDYPQAPFTAVFTPTEIVREYGEGSLFASGLIVDGLHAFGDNLWKACDFALSREKLLEEGDRISLQKDWLRRAKQFASRYFSGDVRKMTYCLKDVSNWKLWLDLKRQYRDVDWSGYSDRGSAASGQAEPACSGGSCEFTGSK